MAVYLYLLDATNLPRWRAGVRKVSLVAGSEGTKGALYRQMVAGRSGLSIPADLEITQARPGAEIEFAVISGPACCKGGYYLSTEDSGTRVRFALEARPEGRYGMLGRLLFLNRMAQRSLCAEVAQLEQLKNVMELQPAL